MSDFQLRSLVPDWPTSFVLFSSGLAGFCWYSSLCGLRAKIDKGVPLDTQTQVRNTEDKIPSLATHPQTHTKTHTHISIYIYIYIYTHISMLIIGPQLHGHFIYTSLIIVNNQISALSFTYLLVTLSLSPSSLSLYIYIIYHIPERILEKIFS